MFTVFINLYCSFLCIIYYTDNNTSDQELLKRNRWRRDGSGAGSLDDGRKDGRPSMEESEGGKEVSHKQ